MARLVRAGAVQAAAADVRGASVGMLAAPTLRAAATIGRSRDDSVWPYDDAKQFRRVRASATDDA